MTRRVRFRSNAPRTCLCAIAPTLGDGLTWHPAYRTVASQSLAFSVVDQAASPGCRGRVRNPSTRWLTCRRACVGVPSLT